MNSIRLNRTAQMMVFLAIFSSVSALAANPTADEREYCTWCHGVSGHGYATAPGLAGQRMQYIEKQLLNFHEHKRVGPIMWSATTFGFSVQSSHAISLYFSAMSPIAANDGDKALVAKGRAIYRYGIPASNIVACAACHGPNAEGVREIPRLGGLSYTYLRTRLEQWHHGQNAAAPSPMPQVAMQLSPDEIKALASYLSFVK
ncbi:MAG: c-type cytochrome [Salinisphaera sp.]|jgi:cytochrome c553|nr:c-type cytochrome [Salinisphaera sp.]